MKNVTFFFFLTFFYLSPLVAQSDIAGTVKDSTGATLPGANAILLRTSDSLLTSFGTTDDKGNFLMEDVAVGSYFLRISYIGYERSDQPIEITASDQYLGLGDLTMYPAGFLLSGVEVTADRIPIRMKGDTMMYDADAFAVGDNASVEDLLRRLPGMSIDANGGITWRGQAVQQVLINGKPFFAGNSTLITQNLDAKALKNVEVFDQKSNKEELSGVDDGEENTTVNLEMKEEFKAKVFGELYAGYGTSERYDAGGKIFRISDASQFGALGTINNANRVGFSGDEMASFNQSIGRGSWYRGGRSNNSGNGELPVFGNDQTPGQNRSIATGINYGTAIGKGQLQLGYALFDRELTQFTESRQAFNRTGNTRETISAETDATDSYSHRLSANFELDLDTTSRLDVDATFFIVGSDGQNLSAVGVSSEGINNNYTVNQNDASQRPSGSVGLDYSRRLGKPGRTMGVQVYGDYGENQNDLSILTVGLTEELAIPGALINGLQTQDRQSTNQSLGGSLEYEEPLSEKWRVETKVNYVTDQVEGDYLFQLEEQRVNNLLTRNWNQASASAAMVRTLGRGNNLSIEAKAFTGELDLSGDVNKTERYNYLLPNLRLRLRSKKGFYNLRINSNPQAPSIAQLQTIAQPGSSGRVTVGNPNLTPSVGYNGSGFMWYNDQFRAVSANANLSVGYTDNAFGNELTFTEGQQIYRTVNVSHAWTSSLFLGTTIGIDAINGEMRLEGRAGGSRGQGFVDGQSRNNVTTNFRGEFSLTTELNTKSFFRAGYTYSQNRNTFDDDTADVIKTVTHDLLGQFELELSKTWRFESRFLYRIFEAAAFAGSATIPDLRTSLEVRPFKKSSHFFRISAFDLFDQNTVIFRQAQAFVTSETTSDALGRYFLATFHYKIK